MSPAFAEREKERESESERERERERERKFKREKMSLCVNGMGSENITRRPLVTVK